MAATFRHRALALSVLAAIAGGCAEAREPINQVQPNALDKTFFVGADLTSTADDPEFWAQGTLVDVGYGASQDGLFTSTYAQPMTRIKWVIQEDLLVARLTYERIAGSDGKGAGPSSTDGQVVAAYRIERHFDIQRSYNPTTGEEMNVITENASDRPWYERKFMRVDWSKNLNTDAYELDTLAQLGIYGGVTYEPLAYAITDPTHEDAPHFDVEQGYFDVTTKAFAKPQQIDLSHLGWGIDKFPACWLDADFAGGGAPAANCNPVELTIRQAFRRVVDNDYEPENWDGQKFQAYGAFTTERFGYQREYGMIDDKWYRFINRYNVWKQSHYYADAATRTGEVSCFNAEKTPPGADPTRDENNDGTADECEEVSANGNTGSQCDVFTHKCTLPYRDRPVATLAWYYTDGSNPFYFESTEWAAHEWDVALRSAIMTARYAECTRTNGENCAATNPVYSGQADDQQDAIALAREVDDCRNGIGPNAGKDCLALADEIAAARGYAPGVVELAKMDEAIVLCHSPVQANDPAACGGPRLPADVTMADCQKKDRDADTAKACTTAFRARIGDIRYHQVNVVTSPQTPSPWGIMVDAHDPLTGEKVAASANVWSHVTDFWSQSVIDLARYIKGELTTEDVTEGTFIREWALAADAAAGGSAGKLTVDERDRKFAEFLGLSKAELNEARERAKMIAPDVREKLSVLAKEIRTIRADALAPSSTRATYEARRKRAQGSDLEAALTTRAMQQLAGLEGLEGGNELFDRASPFRGNALDIRSDLMRRREIALADRGACIMHEAPAPVAIANIAAALEQKFGAFNKNDPKEQQLARAERMRRFVAQRAHYNVMAHEVGHSMGLRHNFVSSSDAWGYRPQYWQLRTDNGTNTETCTDLDPTGACVGPRWFDPINQNEKENLLQMFMQSTVMDYAGETAQDFMGLGPYDFAATRMFYGGVVSVHADSSYKANTNRGRGMVNKLDTFGGLLGIQPVIGAPGNQTRDIHYSELNRNYELISDCEQIDPADYKASNYSEDKYGTWSPLLDGLFVKVGGTYSKCRQQPVDYVAWDKMRPAAQKAAAVDSQNRVRVPYGFATDRWADLGNIAVYRHDNGSDPYELFDFLITQQETMHVFDNYRRRRQTFSVRGAASRALGRYNEKMRDGAKGIGLLVNIYKDFALELGYNFDQLWPVIAEESFAPNLLASGIAFDHFTRQLQRPQSGEHYLDNGVLRSSDDAYASKTTAVSLPNGATGYFGQVSFGGKPLNNALSETRGEYDAEYTILAGSYYEKAWTSMLFTESVDNFISSSRNDFLDARFRSVSLADVFPEGYRRWLANNLTGDDVIKGPRLAATAGGQPIKGADGYPTGPIGWTSWWPKTGPESCFAESSSLKCGQPPANSVVIDPQVGWEQQKFLIAWTLLYLPENEKQQWLNQLGVWEIGADNDPQFPNRIEFHDPNGKIYVARTFGKETIFGKTVQKGIAARMLEYANELLKNAYDTTSGPDLDNDGAPDWYVPAFYNGLPRVKYDPTVAGINPDGTVANNGFPGCNATENTACTCEANRSCMSLGKYSELPFFMRQAMRDYGLAHPSMRGIY